MPSPVAGYSAWYDASQIAGFADGTALTSWADESANGYNLTVARSADPTYYKTTSAKLVNGLPAVWFNGTTQGLGRTATPNGSAAGWTVFAVALISSVSGAQIIFSGDDGSTRTAQYLRLNGGALQTIGFDTAVNVYSASAGSPTVGAAFLASAVMSTSSITARLNGTAGTPTAVSGTPESGSSEVDIGQRVSLTPWNGAICEVLLYNSVLSPANIAANEQYMQAKWATPALPYAGGWVPQRASGVSVFRASYWRERLSGLLTPEDRHGGLVVA